MDGVVGSKTAASCSNYSGQEVRAKCTVQPTSHTKKRFSCNRGDIRADSAVAVVSTATRRGFIYTFAFENLCGMKVFTILHVRRRDALGKTHLPSGRMTAEDTGQSWSSCRKKQKKKKKQQRAKMSAQVLSLW
ncbi:hypothetical protein F2P81_018244 [Scophthalmus maximus]|uniref:Uncharacterized protein n=1 Tax=Scophthalmus maximus TaxID=52904 RepID=A0A6A4S9A4_SCOMX|nr:hypothetical protein F2P81_018244 [Scophthalmus maximus]